MNTRIFLFKFLILLIFINLNHLSADENKIIGFLQSQAIAEQSTGKINTYFKVSRARIGLSGKINEQIAYNVILGAIESPDKNPHLVNAFVDLNYNQLFKVRFGQFMLPFGLEGAQSITANVTIERSSFVRQLNPFRMFRDNGMKVSGKYKSFDYAVAVVNGTGANTSDDNNTKDIIGRIGLSLVKNMQVGFSTHAGKYSLETGKKLNRQRHALDFELDHKGLRLRSEIQSNRDELADGTNKVDRGWYFLSSKNFKQWLEPIIRYEQYFSKSNKTKYNSAIFTLGFNYYLKDNSRISVNYEMINDVENTDTNHRITTQLQIVF